MYQLYLNLGGFEEIKRMCYWEFINIIETLNMNNQRRSGKTITHTTISKSSQNMINKTKKQGQK